MKPKAKATTHVNFTGSLLGDNARKKILSILEENFPKELAAQFVMAANGAIVHAYALAPRLSTRGQRREWFAKVSKTIKPLLAVLREADGDPGEMSKAMSEDLERLDTLLCGYFGRECGPRAQSLIVGALQKLAAESEVQVQRLGRSRKASGPRQELADQLALAWLVHLGKRPASSVSVNRTGTESCCPFMKVLRITVESVDINDEEELTTQALRQTAERAIDWLKKQEAHANSRIPK